MKNKIFTIILLVAMMFTTCAAAALADDQIAAAEDNMSVVMEQPGAAEAQDTHAPQVDAPAAEAGPTIEPAGDGSAQPTDEAAGDMQVLPAEQGEPRIEGDASAPDGEQTACKEHTWVEERVEATCTEEGYIQKKCSVCGAVEKLETLPVIAHNYEKTGEENGIITYTCTVCGDSYTEQEQTVCEHNWVEETVAATCTNEGYTQKKCSVCGVVEDYKTLPVVAHDYKYMGLKNNVATYTCKVCGDSYTKCIAHTWTYETTQPTCTEAGSYARTCVYCGEHEVINTTEPLGHKYEEKMTEIATTTHAGELTYTCKNCGDTYTKAIPRLDAPEEDAIVADPDAVATKAYNSGDNDYYRTSSPMASYLYQRADGNFTRVEAVNEGNGREIVIENYDPDFNLLTARKVEQELPIFGGFFSGQTYNFLVFGQENPSFSDSVEVIRVVKYDKNWRRLDQFSLKGANTSIPFRSGNLRMAEAGDELYIRTSHQMYKSSDGLCHQANVTLALRQSDMELTDSFYKVGMIRYAYVSHSFNQFILTDNDGNIVTLDHGDAYPRAAVLVRFKNAAGKEKFIGENCETLNVQEFVGAVGDNYTGFKLGGFAESGSNYLIAASIDEQSGNFNSSNAYNVVIYAVDKDNVAKSGLKKYQVTSYTSGQNVAAGTPQLVKISSNKFLLMWNELNKGNVSNTLKYTFVDGDGRCGQIYTAEACLSDCQPIVADGKVIWYYGGGALPKFCSIDSDGDFTVERDTAAEKKAADEAAKEDAKKQEELDKQKEENKEVVTYTGENSNAYVGEFRDVKTSAWYADAVKWASEEKLMGAVSNGSFGPNANASRAMIVTVMYRMAGEPSATAVGFSDVAKNQWYANAVNWAANEEVVNGVGENKFAPNSDITRQELAAILYRYAEQAGLDTDFDAAKAKTVCSGFRDYNKVSGWAEDAILWANANGLIAGNSDGTLNPGGKATRAEIATIMMRFVDANK